MAIAHQTVDIPLRVAMAIAHQAVDVPLHIAMAFARKATVSMSLGRVGAYTNKASESQANDLAEVLTELSLPG